MALDLSVRVQIDHMYPLNNQSHVTLRPRPPTINSHQGGVAFYCAGPDKKEVISLYILEIRTKYEILDTAYYALTHSF